MGCFKSPFKGCGSHPDGSCISGGFLRGLEKLFHLLAVLCNHPCGILSLHSRQILKILAAEYRRLDRADSGNAFGKSIGKEHFLQRSLL